MAAVMPALDWRVLVGRIVQDTTKRAVEFFWTPQDNARLLEISFAGDTTIHPFDEILYEVAVRPVGQTGAWTSAGLSRTDCGKWSKGSPNVAYNALVRPWGIFAADTFKGAWGDTASFIYPESIVLVPTFLPMGILRVETVGDSTPP